ncbi:flavodoxin family protein [Bacillus sp. 165]|uniref:flavodoxin family protein n=1 Tax=Bacillus sp. 165 TaxID=1529117 RepID=UPI001ADC4AD0|nr:flavodoxin family protein [Bacillus sp. 165]
MAVLHGSSRNEGNTEYLANVMTKGQEVTNFLLRNLEILPINDKRHDKEGFQPMHDTYETMIKQVLEHDILVFATPIYWYGMSGVMKDFVDRWSQSLRDADIQFKERMSQKKAFVILVGGDKPKIKGLPLILQFQNIFDFVGISFEGYIIGEGNQPGDILKDEQAIAAAKQMNRILSL